MKLGENLGRAAEAKGRAYGPKDYFADKLALDKLAESEGSDPPLDHGERMLQVFNANYMAGAFSRADLDAARETYLEQTPFKFERAKRDIDPEKDAQETMEFLSRLWHSLLATAFAGYWLGLLLVIPTYLLRMVEDRGILETILADKLKFPMAVILWPLYFFRYPSNVVREIIVEAEMRRLKGKIWRRFSDQERRRVKKIANSEYFDSWRDGFNEKNAARIHCRLATALLVTVLLLILAPLTAQASSMSAKAQHKPTIEAVARAGPILQLANSEQINLANNPPPGLFAPSIDWPPLLATSFTCDCRPLIEWLLSLRIDHIPLQRLFGCLLVAMPHSRRSLRPMPGGTQNGKVDRHLHSTADSLFGSCRESG